MQLGYRYVSKQTPGTSQVSYSTSPCLQWVKKP